MPTNRQLTKGEYLEQFRAQIPAIGRKAQEQLRHAQVHVAGLGGVGSQVAMHLADTGIGNITANDPQLLDWEDLNRIPMATIGDIGLPKVTVLDRFLQHRPHIRFQGVQERSESSTVTPMFKEANCIVCCSNTVSSRQACVVAARRFRKSLIDVAVADGRETLAGSVRVYRPTVRDGGACPMCFLEEANRVRRGEGLLATVVAATSAHAAHVVIKTLLGLQRVVGGPTENFVLIDLTYLKIETLFIRSRKDCSVCKVSRR